jgi:hypothetical protein
MLPLLILRIRIRRLTATVKSNAFVAKGSISVVTLSVLYKDLVLVLVIFLSTGNDFTKSKKISHKQNAKDDQCFVFPCSFTSHQ